MADEKLELALVMPVYNEEGCISQVVKSWLKVLSDLKINFHMIVLNDGSIDGTAGKLAAFSGDKRIEIIKKQNSGHGPTILMGYHKAVKLADWVFQCDSDDEMKAKHFPLLWDKHSQYDALFGIRAGRLQNIPRAFISACSQITVRLLFGKGVVDVATPYRLMRSSLLKQIIAQIPDDTLAPNIIISGALAKAHVRLYNVPVPHEVRKTGVTFMGGGLKTWKFVSQSFIQTLRCRPIINFTEHHKPESL